MYYYIILLYDAHPLNSRLKSKSLKPGRGSVDKQTNEKHN
jgi:hypothetical protein